SLAELPDDVVQSLLRDEREKFEAGDATALFAAILWCGRSERPLPKWIVHEFAQAWHRYLERETAANLGEAFGIAWPKGKHAAAYRKKRRLEWDVYGDVCDAYKKGAALDEALFAKVGRKHHIGKKLA